MYKPVTDGMDGDGLGLPQKYFNQDSVKRIRLGPCECLPFLTQQEMVCECK